MSIQRGSTVHYAILIIMFDNGPRCFRNTGLCIYSDTLGTENFMVSLNIVAKSR